MPSEQAVGSPKLSSDIYALGIICIQALTGIYFNREGKMPRGGNGEINWRDSANVSPNFAEILDKMVRYDHRQRYSNAIELLSVIKALKKPGKSRISQKISIGLLGLVAALGLAGFIYTLPLLLKTITPVQLLSYNDEKVGVKIKYPQGWQRQDINNPFTGEWVSFISEKEGVIDDSPEKITIGIQNFNGSLEESKNKIIEQISQDAKTMTSSSATLANKPAYKVIYTTKDGNHTLKSLKIWTLKNFQVYSITYTANIEDYEQFLKATEATINSFEIQ